MKRWMLFSGIVILIVAGLLIYVSGIMNELFNPIYPVLSSMQLLWTLLAVVGTALIISGAVFGRKGKKK